MALQDLVEYFNDRFALQHRSTYRPFILEKGEVNVFLEVDPRENQNIVITMTVYSQYDQYYQELINGLDNYRRRGYQIALKFDYMTQKSQSFDLIATLSPDYVSFSARNIDNKIEETLQQLKIRMALTGGLSILQQIDDKKSDMLARNVGFDLVEGTYYRVIAFDYFDDAKQKNLNIPLSEKQENR